MRSRQEHLDYLAREYLAYYHQDRPHQAKDNQPLIPACDPIHIQGEVVCVERLGGVLRHYRREAA